MRNIVFILLGLAVSVPTADAQLLPNTDPGRAVRLRSDLERLLEQYEAALSSPAYSESVKRQIRADALRIRDRLENGDFRTGDRVVIGIQGELNYPDTVMVEPGPMIALPEFGTISLAGVLRSEIEPHLTTELRRFILNPIVRASGLMRVGVIGAVGSPGFHTMPAETLLGDVLMMAGGPSTSADLEEIRIERGSQRLFAGDDVSEAIREGLTLDQLNLQAGDQIVVPDRSQGNVFGTVLSAIGAIGSVSFLLFQIF